MGCTFSGLNAVLGAVNGGGDVWINENRFRTLKQLAVEGGGSAFIYLAKEIPTNTTADDSSVSSKLSVSSGLTSKLNDPSLVSHDGTYAMKKLLIQNDEQLELVKEEIRVSSLFRHQNLLPLLDHAIISVKVTPGRTWTHEAYLLFPVHLDGTIVDNYDAMKAKESFTTSDVLRIFQQLCAGLKHMHSLDHPYAHNDVKPSHT